MTDREALARRLERARKAAQLSWADVSRLSGYTPGYLRCVRKAEKSLTLTSCRAVAAALGVAPAWLAGWSAEGGPRQLGSLDFLVPPLPPVGEEHEIVLGWAPPVSE